MSLKELKKKWPKAKIKKEFKDNNNRYPDSLKRAVLEAINDSPQVQVSKATGIKVGLISNWKCGRFKGAETPKKTKKKVKVIDKETRIKEEIKKVSKVIERVNLVQYLDDISALLIFKEGGEYRDTGYKMAIVAELIKLLNNYLRNPSKKAFDELLENKIIKIGSKNDKKEE